MTLEPRRQAMNMRRTLSWPGDGQSSPTDERRRRLRKVNLQLRAQGFQVSGIDDPELGDVATGLLQAYRERCRLLHDYRCPADQRIEAFLASHFADLKLPQ